MLPEGGSALTAVLHTTIGRFGGRLKADPVGVSGGKLM